MSLVTCPVAMTPATTEAERIRFRTLNRKTGHPITSRYVDAITDEPVEADDQVKGYQQSDESYVEIEDEDLDAVALESTRTIDIDVFVPKTSIGWIWFDKPHYLVPNDKVGEEAFAVIRDAMASTETVGIARLVLYRRERAVMLEPRDKGIVLWTLHFGDEVRPSPGSSDLGVPDKDAKASSMIKTLIKDLTQDWQPDLLQDPVQDRLLDIIEAKKKGRRPPKAKRATAPPSNVIDIMDALKKSLANEKPTGKR